MTEERIENIAAHGGESPTGTIHIETTTDSVTVTIADDGPGLPEIEQNILTGKAETALNHGQGVGLWLTYWSIKSADGEIDAIQTDAGTELTIEFPRPSANDQLIDAPVEST